MALKFQFMQSKTKLNRAIVAAAVAGLLLAGAGIRDARSEAWPFAALNGSWSGAGTIKKSNGASERIRCRSAFEPAGAANLSLRLRCASDSYNFDLTAGVAYQGGAISGSWQESTRNVGGGISGHSASDGRHVAGIPVIIALPFPARPAATGSACALRASDRHRANGNFRCARPTARRAQRAAC